MARILIIDDEVQLRSLLRRVLEQAGYDVAEAADGNQGIKDYQQHPADLVLCDLIMPDKEGLETIRELRTASKDTKIVAMSGGGRRGTADFLPIAAKLGAVKTLHKPFDMQTLLAVVGEALAPPCGASGGE